MIYNHHKDYNIHNIMNYNLPLIIYLENIYHKILHFIYKLLFLNFYYNQNFFN